MSARIIRTLATVNAVFPADQPRILGLFVGDRTNPFGQHFDLAQISVEQLKSGGFAWRGRRGSWRRGERLLLIDSIHGSDLELGVRVDGETGDAEDLLMEVWAELGSSAGEAEVELESSGPAREHETVTVLEADQPYWDHLTNLGKAEDFLRERLGDRLATSPRRLKIEVPVSLSVGGLVQARSLRIETRFTADGGRHYYVSSPLPSTDHRELLERFFGEVSAG